MAKESAVARYLGPALPIASLLGSTTACILVWRFHGHLRFPALAHMLSVVTPIGLIFFLAAVIASPLHHLAPGRLTQWMVTNRKYLGLSFAAWHLQHLWIVGKLVDMVGFMSPKTKVAPPLMDWPGQPYASLILLVIVAMTITSIPRIQRSMGRWWAVLHTFGIHVVAFWAVRVYLTSREPPQHRWIHIGAILAAFALRIYVSIRKRLSASQEKVSGATSPTS